MSNCIILLNKLNRDEEALAIADALGQRYASDSALETREKAANGLMLAGAIHTKHGDAGKTIEFCDDVFRWFGDGVASSFERICSGATTSAFLMALKAGLWREALRVIERLSLLQNKSLVGLLFAEAALLAEERDSGQLSLVEAVEAGDSLLSLVDDLADSAQSEAATVERQQLVASIEMMLARWLLDGGAWERAQALLGATQRRLENTPLDLSTSELRMLREMQAERMRFGAPEELTEVYVFRLDNGRRTPHVDELLKRKGSHLDDLLK